MSRAWLLAAAFLPLLLVGCSKPEDPVNGAWYVSTDLLKDSAPGNAQYLDGTLLVSDGPDGGKLCSLNITAHSYVLRSGFRLGEYTTSNAQQTCQIVTTGVSVSIQSTVSSGPEGYTPDNFDMTLDGDTMTGIMTSSQSSPATMTRKTGAPIPARVPPGFAGRKTVSGQAEGWLHLTDTTTGCKLDWKSPATLLDGPTSVRAWIRSSCGGTTPEGETYDRTVMQLWYVCSDSRLYEESVIYYLNGNVVREWAPRPYGILADGPTLRQAGLGGKVMQPEAANRVLFDRMCA